MFKYISRSNRVMLCKDRYGKFLYRIQQDVLRNYNFDKINEMKMRKNPQLYMTKKLQSRMVKTIYDIL